MTVRELAKRLNLGKTTVALALRGSPKVSPETRRWVKEQAEQIGYVENIVASAFLQQLRSKGSKRYHANLAFFTPRSAGTFMKQVLKGAEERARELGYGLSVFRPADFESKKLESVLLARGISGIIVGPLEHAIGHLSLDWSRFAVTACGYSMARPAVHRVTHNHLHGIRTVFRMCMRKGFRRIGLALSHDSDARSDWQWSSGYFWLQRKIPARHRIDPLLVTHAKFTQEAIREWILAENPEVIILHAAGCVPKLAPLLKSLPTTVHCVLLDRLPGEPYAGIDQRFQLTGMMLVDSVSSQLLYNRRGLPNMPIVSAVEGEWVDHPSLVR